MQVSQRVCACVSLRLVALVLRTAQKCGCNSLLSKVVIGKGLENCHFSFISKTPPLSKYPCDSEFIDLTKRKDLASKFTAIKTNTLVFLGSRLTLGPCTVSQMPSRFHSVSRQLGCRAVTQIQVTSLPPKS